MPGFFRIRVVILMTLIVLTGRTVVGGAGTLLPMSISDANGLYLQNPSATAEPTTTPSPRSIRTATITAAPTDSPAPATAIATNTSRPSSVTPRSTNTLIPTITPLPPTAILSPTNTATYTRTITRSATSTRTLTPTFEATPGALPAPIPSTQVAVEAVRAANQWLLALACGLLLMLLAAAWLLVNRAAKIERSEKQ